MRNKPKISYEEFVASLLNELEASRRKAAKPKNAPVKRSKGSVARERG